MFCDFFQGCYKGRQQAQRLRPMPNDFAMVARQTDSGNQRCATDAPWVFTGYLSRGVASVAALKTAPATLRGSGRTDPGPELRSTIASTGTGPG